MSRPQAAPYRRGMNHEMAVVDDQIKQFDDLTTFGYDISDRLQGLGKAITDAYFNDRSGLPSPSKAPADPLTVRWLLLDAAAEAPGAVIAGATGGWVTWVVEKAIVQGAKVAVDAGLIRAAAQHDRKVLGWLRVIELTDTNVGRLANKLADESERMSAGRTPVVDIDKARIQIYGGMRTWRELSSASESYRKAHGTFGPEHDRGRTIVSNRAEVAILNALFGKKLRPSPDRQATPAAWVHQAPDLAAPLLHSRPLCEMAPTSGRARSIDGGELAWRIQQGSQWCRSCGRDKKRS